MNGILKIIAFLTALISPAISQISEISCNCYICEICVRLSLTKSVAPMPILNTWLQCTAVCEFVFKMFSSTFCSSLMNISDILLPVPHPSDTLAKESVFTYQELVNLFSIEKQLKKKSSSLTYQNSAALSEYKQ